MTILLNKMSNADSSTVMRVTQTEYLWRVLTLFILDYAVKPWNCVIFVLNSFLHGFIVLLEYFLKLVFFLLESVFKLFFKHFIPTILIFEFADHLLEFFFILFWFL